MRQLTLKYILNALQLANKPTRVTLLANIYLAYLVAWNAVLIQAVKSIVQMKDR